MVPVPAVAAAVRPVDVKEHVLDRNAALRYWEKKAVSCCVRSRNGDSLPAGDASVVTAAASQRARRQILHQR